MSHFVGDACSPSSAKGVIIGHAPPLPARRQMGKPMDERIEAFLTEVLVLEGEISNLLREGVRRRLAICEKQFRDAETHKRMKDRAAHACRTLDAATQRNIDRRTSEDSAQYLRFSGALPFE
jgi:hypothetical protein